MPPSCPECATSGGPYETGEPFQSLSPSKYYQTRLTDKHLLEGHSEVGTYPSPYPYKTPASPTLTITP